MCVEQLRRLKGEIEQVERSCQFDRSSTYPGGRLNRDSPQRLRVAATVR